MSSMFNQCWQGIEEQDVKYRGCQQIHAVTSEVFQILVGLPLCISKTYVLANMLWNLLPTSALLAAMKAASVL